MLKVLVFVAILVGLSTADVLYSNLNNLYLKIVSPSAGSFFAIRLDTTTYASVLDRLDTDGFNKLQLTYSLSIPQSQTDYTLTINPTTKNAILVATDDAFDNNNFYIGEYNSTGLVRSRMLGKALGYYRRAAVVIKDSHIILAYDISSTNYVIDLNPDLSTNKTLSFPYTVQMLAYDAVNDFLGVMGYSEAAHASYTELIASGGNSSGALQLPPIGSISIIAKDSALYISDRISNSTTNGFIVYKHTFAAFSTFSTYIAPGSDTFDSNPADLSYDANGNLLIGTRYYVNDQDPGLSRMYQVCPSGKVVAFYQEIRDSSYQSIDFTYAFGKYYSVGATQDSNSVYNGSISDFPFLETANCQVNECDYSDRNYNCGNGTVCFDSDITLANTFTCKCNITGYSVFNGSCQLNECTTAGCDSTGTIVANCTDPNWKVSGDYTCKCPGKYVLNAQKTCVWNECDDVPCGTHSTCVDNDNTEPGFYVCTCTGGYVLYNGKCVAKIPTVATSTSSSTTSSMATSSTSSTSSVTSSTSSTATTGSAVSEADHFAVPVVLVILSVVTLLA